MIRKIRQVSSVVKSGVSSGKRFSFNGFGIMGRAARQRQRRGRNLAVGPGVNEPEDKDMRRASLAGLLAAAVPAAGGLVEMEKAGRGILVEGEGDGDQVLVWLR
jgi:hypothetical protein